MRRYLLLPGLITALFAAIGGCSAGAVGSNSALSAGAQSGPFEPRVIASGRSQCGISFVESAEGAIDPTGRYLALPGFCARSSRFGDHVVEIIDLQRERSIQVYDYSGSGEGYPFFAADGTLFAFSHLARTHPENPPGYLSNIANLRTHRWEAPYNASPSIEDFRPAPRDLRGTPRDMAPSPDGHSIAVSWVGFGALGAIQVLPLSSGPFDDVITFTNAEFDWDSERGEFEPNRLVWLGDRMLWVWGSGVFSNRISSHANPENRAGSVVIDPYTGRLLRDPTTGELTDPSVAKFGSVDWHRHASAYVGMPVNALPNGVLVLEGGNDGRPPESQSNVGEYDLQVRSLDDFSFIGGIAKPSPLERTLAGYDFSPDGERAYMLLRDGTLRIYHTRSWELIATLPVRALGLRQGWPLCFCAGNIAVGACPAGG